MFVYNSSVHSSTGKQPYELLYGKTLLVPNSLTKAPDARYNYDDYQTELKQKLRESHQIARERLIQKKQKTKFDYDQTAHSVDIHVGDRVLLQDKARKGKLSAKWLGPYEVLELNCNDNVTILRVRRGLFNAVGRVSKVLFGVCSDEDAEFLNSKISELSNARTDTLNILEAETRIVRATVTDINSTLTAISKERKNMGDLVTHLTHPSLMTHQQYVEHLREIQLTLPIGSNLPFPLEKFSIKKFIQVTQVAILLANNTLIFIQKIPLISSNSYKGYRLKPFPVRQQGQTYSIFTSVPSVLALSSNREYFIPLTESQLGNCKRIDTSLYCSQITCMYSSTNTICGANSLLGLKENSSVCKVQYVKITNSIFSTLESTNTWLYISVSENVAIKCDNEDPHNIILNGTGQLTLNPQCVLYAKQTILFPSQTIVRNSSQNLYNPIQSEGLGFLSVTNISQDLFESLKFLESHYSIGLEDLSRHSKSLKEIEELIKVEKNTNYVPKESNLYLIISLVIISTILITLLSSVFSFVKYTARIPIMYQPQDVVAETEI
ncbi:hypothetical protein QTP88_001765 [Uroleucon formosanum]